jgi:hypothetical protein
LTTLHSLSANLTKGGGGNRLMLLGWKGSPRTNTSLLSPFISYDENEVL